MSKFRGPEGAGTATRFKAGVSGNPSGRPSSRMFTEVLWAELEKIDPKTRRTNAEELARALVAKGKKGFVGAIQEIGDRIQGKATQPIFLDTGIDQKTCEIIADLASRLLDSGPTAAPRMTQQVNELHGLTCECSPCLQKRFAQSEQETAKQLGQVKLLGKADAVAETRTERQQLRDGLAIPITASSYGQSYSIPLDLQGECWRKPE